MKKAGALGVVVIGRNEGQRLLNCLRSVAPQADLVVYVDSGSTDGSAEAASTRGVEVVLLDASIPFTAARARNAGIDRLIECHPGLRYVQFVDGDCELEAGWLEKGTEALERRPDLGVVCGRRREKHPGASLYNLLCDLEWDTPVGEAAACGGDALFRVDAFRGVGGFNAALIAGEEPELCVRLRLSGWKVERLDATMTLHDVAMTRFPQWWKRAVRAGYAYAEGACLHGAGPTRHYVHPLLSSLALGFIAPVAAIIPVWLTGGWSLLLFFVYPLQWLRIYRNQRRRQRPPVAARVYASFTLLAKFARVEGIVRFLATRLRRRQSTIIEYKKAAPATVTTMDSTVR